MNYEPLIEELKKPQYVGTSDQQAADICNALTVRVACNVKIVDVLKYSVDQGIYGKVNADAFDPSLPRDQRIAIWNIKGWVDNPSNPSEFADMTSQTAATMIADLVRFGYATNAHAQELADMGFKTIRWVDHVGIGTQSADSIRVAREDMSGLTERRQSLLSIGANRWNAFVSAVESWNGVGHPPEL